MKKLVILIFAILLAINVYSSYLISIPVELKQPDSIHTKNLDPATKNGIEMHQLIELKTNQRPVVADNSKWFPPIEQQTGGSCTHFSLIYYLKSYLWNRHFNRDPKLTENQFSPYFVWNQNINTSLHMSDYTFSIEFMRNQGCSSVSDFTLFPNSEEVMPSLGSKEIAMSFKSKRFTTLGSSDPMFYTSNATERINAIKDSLLKGNPCVIDIPLFKNDYWFKNGNDIILDYSKEIDWSTNNLSHAIVIVGYNDTIKTKYGKGAFMLINSWGTQWGNNGFGYIAYDWFYQTNWVFSVLFLEENFEYRPDILLNLDIENTISDEDRFKYFFVDTTFNYRDKIVDFPSGSLSYIQYPNILKINSINGRKKIFTEDEKLEPNSTYSINNRLLVPQHNHTGNYEILSDLTEYLNGETFKSCEILINDPISATFTGDNDQQLFSFVREAKAEVSSVFIKSLKSSFIIKGKVLDLPDTTIMCTDFYSSPGLLGSQLTPYCNDYIHIKQSTAKLKRKKIAFNIADKQTFIVPVAKAGPDQTVNEGSIVSLDGSNSFAPDGSPMTYRWNAPKGISLSSTIVKNPTFSTLPVSQDTSYIFSLVVNDGISDSPADEVVITVKHLDKIPVANAGLDIMLPEGMTLTLDGSGSSDPNGKTLTYKWTVPKGITFDSLTIAKPTFTAPEVTTNTSFIITLVVNNGTYNSCEDQILITVKNYNKVPVANAGTDQILTLGATVNLDGSKSSDADGEPLTYKWTAPAGITLSSSTVANPTFTAPEVTSNTNYVFSLVVNDGTVDSPSDEVVITVKQVNQTPVANAGVDQSVNEGATVSLDGSASSDPDGNPLTYKWTAPTGITLNSSTVANPNFTAPEVTTNTNYTFLLVVNDGTVDSPADEVVITVKQVNQAPVANAGVDQSVNEGATVSLDGSVSSDPDGNPLTYKWTFPAGVTLSSATAAKPTFTAPEVTADTNYTFSLVVNDGTIDSPVDLVIITVKNVNKPPIANAGADQSINEGATVSLDGSASSDPDGNPLTYKWTFPAGVTLSSTTSAKPTFKAPEVTLNTNYTFSLVVNDGIVASPVDQVVITVKNVNKAPIANAGIDQTVNEGVTVTLDGSASTDPDGNTLTYKWIAPTGITLNSATAAKAIFKAPEVKQDTILDFTLNVNDRYVDSEPSIVHITVKNIIKTDLVIIGLNGLKVFPNPSNGILKIEGLLLNQNNKIFVYTINGKLIKTKITYSTTETIDISDQVSGIYLLNINEQTFKIRKK